MFYVTVKTDLQLQCPLQDGNYVTRVDELPEQQGQKGMLQNVKCLDFCSICFNYRSAHLFI